MAIHLFFILYGQEIPLPFDHALENLFYSKLQPTSLFKDIAQIQTHNNIQKMHLNLQKQSKNILKIQGKKSKKYINTKAYFDG